MNLKNLNKAEFFAFFRVITFPIILILIFLEQRTLTAWLYLIFFSTDAIDGTLAVFFNMESERRAKLDTLGDILYLLTGAVGYWVFETAHFREHQFQLGTVGGLYLLQLAFSMSKWGKPSSYHTWLAKLTAFVQVLFLVWMFFFGIYQPLFYAAITLSLLDALEDICITILLKKRESHLKGLPWVFMRKEK